MGLVFFSHISNYTPWLGECVFNFCFFILLSCYQIALWESKSSDCSPLHFFWGWPLFLAKREILMKMHFFNAERQCAPECSSEPPSTQGKWKIREMLDHLSSSPPSLGIGWDLLSYHMSSSNCRTTSNSDIQLFWKLWHQKPTGGMHDLQLWRSMVPRELQG